MRAAGALLGLALVVLLAWPASAQSDALTASFVESTVPDAHEGTGQTFTVRIQFSEDLAVSFRVLRDHALEVENGDARRFKRVDGSNSLWEIHARPSSDQAVTLRLPKTTDCNAADAVCTADDKPLSHAVTLTIPGPATEPTATTTPEPSATPTAAQLAPSGLTATESNGSVGLSWNAPEANADLVTGYDVERFDSPDSTVAGAVWVVLAASTNMTDASVSTGQTYRYRVAARRGSDQSEWTGEVSLTTAPSAAQLTPTDLFLRESDADVTITWTRPSFDANLSGYAIQRATGDGEFSTLSDSLGAGDNVYRDATVAVGTSYRYRIAAQHGTQQSNWTEAASITTATAAQLAPSNLRARQTAKAVLLQWDRPDAKRGSITGYTIERAVVGGEFAELVANTGSTDLTYTDASGEAETTYRYRVAAVRTIGGAATTSDWTSEASATTPAATPALVAVETPMVNGVVDTAWSTTLTVGKSYSSLGYLSNKGSLSDTTYSWQGYDLTVQSLYRYRGTLYLTATTGSFSTDKQVAQIDLSTLDDTWALRLGDTDLLLSEATVSYRGHRSNGVDRSWVSYVWTDTGLSWSKDDEVAVSLNSVDQFIDPDLIGAFQIAAGSRLAKVTVDLTEVLDDVTLHLRLTATADSEADPQTWEIAVDEPSEHVELDISLLTPGTEYLIEASWQSDFPDDYTKTRTFSTSSQAPVLSPEDFMFLLSGTEGDVVVETDDDVVEGTVLWESTLHVDKRPVLRVSGPTTYAGYRITYTQTGEQRDNSTAREEIVCVLEDENDPSSDGHCDGTGNYTRSLDYTKSTRGSLSTTSFRRDGISHDVNRVALDAGKLTVWVHVGRNSGRWNANDLPFDFVLKVGSREFRSAEASSRFAFHTVLATCYEALYRINANKWEAVPCSQSPDGGQRYMAFTWDASGLSWSHGDMVPLQLVEEPSIRVESVVTTALTKNSATVEVTVDAPVAGTIYARYQQDFGARRMAHPANELSPIQVAQGATTVSFTITGLNAGFPYVVQASTDPGFDVSNAQWARESYKFTTHHRGETGNRSEGLCHISRGAAAVGDYYFAGGSCIRKQ